MKCPHCQKEIRDGSKFCTECGVSLVDPYASADGRAAAQTAAASASFVLGQAAREARKNADYTDAKLIGTRAYNAILIGVLLYGLLMNVILCVAVGDIYEYVSPIVFLIAYLGLSIGGVFLAGKSQNPWLSFLGYNMVVVPFGLVISSFVTELGGLDSEIVLYAFVYTVLIAFGMLATALLLPKLFEKLGGALLGVLIGVVVCELALLLFGVEQSITDWIAAGVFSLYIGYDS